MKDKIKSIVHHSNTYIVLIKYYTMKPIFSSSRKSLASLLLRKYCLINIPVLRSKQVMFWALQLRNLLIPSNKIGAKRPSQRSGLTGWLLLYNIAESLIVGSVLLSMLWL